MQQRKKKELDGIDREILRALFKRSPLVSRKIAEIVGLTASAIAPRLNNLQKKGIVKPSKILGMRSFQRKFNDKTRRIKAPHSIYWDLDIQ